MPSTVPVRNTRGVRLHVIRDASEGETAYVKYNVDGEAIMVVVATPGQERTLFAGPAQEDPDYFGVTD